MECARTWIVDERARRAGPRDHLSWSSIAVEFALRFILGDP